MVNTTLLTHIPAINNHKGAGLLEMNGQAAGVKMKVKVKSKGKGPYAYKLKGLCLIWRWRDGDRR